MESYIGKLWDGRNFAHQAFADFRQGTILKEKGTGKCSEHAFGCQRAFFSLSIF
jgi:hypothetical protein